MRLLGRSDAALAFRALGEMGLAPEDVVDRGAAALAVAKALGWTTTKPLHLEGADGQPVDVTTGSGVRPDTERALTALYSLAEAGAITPVE